MHFEVFNREVKFECGMVTNARCGNTTSTYSTLLCGFSTSPPFMKIMQYYLNVFISLFWHEIATADLLLAYFFPLLAQAGKVSSSLLFYF